MKKRYGLFLASFLGLIGLLLIVLIGYVVKIEDVSMNPLLEKFDIQDPGYLKIPIRIVDKNTHEALSFDPLKGKPAVISYKLTKPAWVRVRIRHRDEKELIFRTMLDWTPKKFGRHELMWDGRDTSGNIINNKKAFFIFEANSKAHAQHERKRCHDLQIRISEPTDTSIPAINVPDTIKVVLIGDSEYGNISGYELRYYIDYMLQDRISYPPNHREFTFTLDGKGLSRSEHLLIVNIDDHNDHIGAASIKINIKNQNLQTL